MPIKREISFWPKLQIDFRNTGDIASVLTRKEFRIKKASCLLWTVRFSANIMLSVIVIAS